MAISGWQPASVSWDATCRRGRQKLAVSVRTGEKPSQISIAFRTVPR